MRDMGLSVLAKYGLEATSTYRGRGALVCQCGETCYLIKEFHGSAAKLEQLTPVLEEIECQGNVLVDKVVKNTEQEYVSEDVEGGKYILKQWYEGKECDTKSIDNIMQSAVTLATIHQNMHGMVDKLYKKESLLVEYEKHNQELKKIQSFIRKKHRKNEFEQKYLESLTWFLEKAKETLELLKQISYDTFISQALERGEICHGDFNQHNIIFTKNGVAVINFDKWNYDTQMTDVYHFTRKIMEKHNWDFDLFEKIIQAYCTKKVIDPQEWEYLCIRFSYPEKYWKLANYYYNNNKAWISWKNTEKLQTVIKQKTNWEKFVRNIQKYKGNIG